VVGVTAFPYAHNWTTLLPPYWNRLEKKIADENDTKCRKFAGRLINGEKVYNRFIDAVVGILLLPLIIAFLLIGHKFLAKTMFANHHCNGCGQCAKNCPKGAIKMLGGRKKTPYWTFKCEQCMRCSGFCPKKAVEGSYLLIITHFTVYSLLGAIPFTIAGFFNFPGGINTIASYLILLVFLLFIFFVIYLVFYLLNMIPVLRRFFSYLTPTYYWRKYREPNTKGL
ncbi:MAG TPA: 4Fe-4S binding protein, partial [Clostridia bacterium]|nr:4Fe-4S binding protein [Clostridia bacterium]